MSVSFIHIGVFKIQHTQISAVNDTDCCLKRPKRKILLSYSICHSLKLPFKCVLHVEQNPEWQSNLMMCVCIWQLTAVWDTFIICANELIFLLCFCRDFFFIIIDVHVKVNLVSPYLL